MYEAQHTSDRRITPRKGRATQYFAHGGYTTDRWATSVPVSLTARPKSRRILELGRLSHNLFAVGCYHHYNNI
jgi:hypothetical protein